MTNLVITPQSNAQLKQLEKLLKEMGIASRAVSDEDIEDSGLLVLMKKADRTKKVSRKTIMKKLA